MIAQSAFNYGTPYGNEKAPPRLLIGNLFSKDEWEAINSSKVFIERYLVALHGELLSYGKAFE